MVVDVIRLIESNKAKFAFLAPLITAIGTAIVSWIVTGNFNGAEIRTAASGAVLGAVSGIATWLAPAGRAVVDVNEEQQLPGADEEYVDEPEAEEAYDFSEPDPRKADPERRQGFE